MILWGVIFGGLIGWCVAGFEEWGTIFGAMVGSAAGWTLRTAVRSEIAKIRETILAEAQAVGPIAASVPIAASARTRDDAVADRIDRQDRPAAEPEPAAETARADRIADRAATDGLAAARSAVPPRPGIAGRAFAAARGWLLGGNTIVRAGLVILFVGLSFLARYAAAAGLFPVEARLALVVAAGIALLVVGFRTRARKPEFALALQGTGIATIYLTIFAAARLFEAMPVLPAFVLMIVVCALGCALALLQNAQSLAVAAFVGGFAVPVLLAGEGGGVVTLFGYYTVLNLAVLFFARMRSWRFVTLVGFFGTFGVATLWGMRSYRPADFATAQFFLILSVLIYVAAALFYSRNTPGRIGRVVDTTMVFGPALAGFGLEVGLVQHIAFGSAFAALGFATLYIATAALMLRRGREEFRILNEAMLAIGVGFVTLAIPLALGARWTSSAWALEGAGAFWIGMRQERWMPRLFGLLLQAVAALIVLADVPANISALPILNPGFIGAALIALAGLTTAWWLREPLAHSGARWASGYAAIERSLGRPVFLCGFAFWWLALLSEISRAVPSTVSGVSAAPVFASTLQPLLAMLAFVASAAVSAVGGHIWRWPVALWPSRVTLGALLLAFLAQSELHQHLLYTPQWAIWSVALALHYWLLFRDETRDVDRPRLSLLHRVVHIGGAWLLTGMVADCLWLGIDRGGLWDTSWAGVVFLVSVVAVLLLVTLWAAAARPGDRRAARWPLRQHAIDYGWFAALPIVATVYVGALATALIASGNTAPLPYVPLLNPVDLTLMLAVAALLLWRRAMVTAAPRPSGSAVLHGRAPLVATAILGFIVLNTMWLRFAHHALGVPWSGTGLLDSFVVQMGLAILWTLLALGLMLFAHRRPNRVLWITGAGLLGLVVIKLLMVDLNNEDGAVRIVTFLVVGVLMLVVGYFAPLPPKAGTGSTLGGVEA